MRVCWVGRVGAYVRVCLKYVGWGDRDEIMDSPSMLPRDGARTSTRGMLVASAAL